MKRLISRISLIAVLVMLFAVSLSSSAHAFGRVAVCGQSCIDGGYNIGGGTYLSNAPGGAGARSGYGAVRYDAFAPESQGGKYVECDTPRRSLFDDLGIPASFDGPFYWHKRVAVARGAYQVGNVVTTPNVTIVGGIQPNILQDANLDFNADTGTTRPSQHSSSGPSQSNPWISPDYADASICLPLRGGNEVQEYLQADPPDVTFKPGVKAVVNMKKAKVEVEVVQRSLDENGVQLQFELTNFVVLVCDTKKAVEGVPLSGCTLGTEKSSPVYISKANIAKALSGVDSADVSVSLPVKFKKKGSFAIAIIAVYDGEVHVNGVLQNRVTGITVVPEDSDIPTIAVRSSKAVNKK